MRNFLKHVSLVLFITACATTNKSVPKNIKDVSAGDVLKFQNLKAKKLYSDCAVEVLNILTHDAVEQGFVKTNPIICGYLTCEKGSMTDGSTMPFPVCLPVKYFLEDVNGDLNGFGLESDRPPAPLPKDKEPEIPRI